METGYERLRSALRAFLETSPLEPQKPSAGLAIISRPEELDLLQAVHSAGPLSEGMVAQLGQEVDLAQSYLLLDFAVRSAIYAVRAGSPRALHNGAFALVLDRDLLDYRDVLVALSVIEDCALRLGSDLKSSITPVLGIATEKRRDTIMGYLGRPPELRGLGVMGMVVSGEGPMLTYSMRPW